VRRQMLIEPPKRLHPVPITSGSDRAPPGWRMQEHDALPVDSSGLGSEGLRCQVPIHVAPRAGLGADSPVIEFQDGLPRKCAT
jgi:hypothetical protein